MPRALSPLVSRALRAPVPHVSRTIPTFKLDVSLALRVLNLFILFIYFQFIYGSQILFHLTIRLAFHKQQGFSQTSGAINNIAECCYR